MIQRIQSIYLAVATIILSLAAFLPVPFAYSGTNPLFYNISFDATKTSALVLGGLTILAAIVALANIFLFRNRKLQLKICTLTSLLLLLMIVAGAYFLLSDTHTPDQPWAGTAFPLLGYISNWLARRNINADQKLVESADRLR